jgi:hypothetical protein
MPSFSFRLSLTTIRVDTYSVSLIGKQNRSKKYLTEDQLEHFAMNTAECRSSRFLKKRRSGAEGWSSHANPARILLKIRGRHLGYQPDRKVGAVILLRHEYEIYFRTGQREHDQSSDAERP